jgi:hypothetical protein
VSKDKYRSIKVLVHLELEYLLVKKYIQERKNTRIMKDKGYEHELTLNNGDLYYVVSTTFYINKEDREYLVEQTIDLNEVKSVRSYKL